MMEGWKSSSVVKVEHVFCMCKALDSIPSTDENKTTKSRMASQSQPCKVELDAIL